MMAFTQTFVFFNDGSVVLLLHDTGNYSAAKRAMLKKYGRSEKEVSRTGSSCVGKSYTTFDGTDAH